VLTNEAGENLIYADIIEYDPENTKVLLVLDPHQIVNDSIIISAHIENESMVGSYKGFIKNELTGAVPLNISKPFSENPIQIPLASLEPLQYDILVQAFDQNGSLLAQDEQSFTYIPQKPSLFSRISAGLKQNPWVLFLIFFIIISVILYFVWKDRLQKKRSGTPFLNLNDELTLPAEKIDLPINITQINRRISHPQTPKASPANAHTKAILQIQESGDKTKIGKEFTIPQTQKVVLGRAKCDITIVDEKMSRQHAEIFFRDGHFWINDLGSTNKTYLNSRQAHPEKPLMLTNAAKLKLGNTIISVELR